MQRFAPFSGNSEINRNGHFRKYTIQSSWKTAETLFSLFWEFTFLMIPDVSRCVWRLPGAGEKGTIKAVFGQKQARMATKNSLLHYSVTVRNTSFTSFTPSGNSVFKAVFGAKVCKLTNTLNSVNNWYLDQSAKLRPVATAK